MLPTGIVISLGALLVSVTDNPGPIHHRRNGMMACLAGVIILSLLAGFASQNAFVYGGLLISFSFLCSMSGVYGARAGGVGVATLLAFILTAQNSEAGFQQSLTHALLMGSGGLWYLCFSLLLYNFRPYRLAQQALGECIQEQAQYLRIRAEFYHAGVDYEKTSDKLLSQQALINERQQLLGEIILKTRHIVKEVTLTSRMILMMYLDLDEMFEKITTSYQRYSLLHTFFDENGILDDYRRLALLVADELEETGIAVKSGSVYFASKQIQERIDETKTKLETLRQQTMNAKNLEGFISLRRIIENIQDLANRIKSLQLYANNDPSLHQKKLPEIELDKFLNPQQLSKETFASNLTLQSEIFRHSLRMTIALFVGFVVAFFIDINHSYWILLTITVILKPAYSLTKKRNIDRLTGTVLGIIIGVVFVRLVENDNYLLGIMILFMVGSYTYMRTNYFVSVLLMTTYIMMFFHFLYPGSFKELLIERIIDTSIGSAIAFTASFFILPLWQKDKIRPLMITMLDEACAYFKNVSLHFTRQQDMSKQQKGMLRKNALVALANLTDTFNRMLNEPVRQQKGIEQIHRFVVLNQMFLSYVGSFNHTLQMKNLTYQPHELKNVLDAIEKYLDTSRNILQIESIEEPINMPTNETLKILQKPANQLLQKRKQELEAGLLETDTKRPLFETKSVVDQFTFIFQTAAEMYKTTKVFVKEG